MIICDICGQDKDEEKAEDMNMVCAHCWGPRAVDTDCVPIPNELLWEDSYLLRAQ